MRNETYLYDFVNVKPPTRIEQDDSIRWLIERHKEPPSAEVSNLERMFRHCGIKKNKISARYFAINDWQMQSKDSMTIYSENCFNDISHKANFFNQYAIDIFRQFYPQKETLPHHVIHVTCTGYVSPSAPQVIVGDYNAECSVTHAYHMGCYAAFPASRMAIGFASSQEGQKIDVVHTEACSLHMDKTIHTPEQMVIQSLFADGNIKYSVSATKPPKPSFLCLAMREHIVPGSANDMRWELKKWGFGMTLSRLVPEKIATALTNFLVGLAKDIGIAKKELLTESIFAIHPGGPKIVDMVASQLNLSSEQIRFSNKVLFERGNMSSATLPHVWEEILKANQPNGRIILSLAFGPGLTLFGTAFRLVT